MKKNSPYNIIKSRYITEKTHILEELKNNRSNPSVAKYDLSKYVFLVEKKANKQEIAEAVEEIYADKNIKVASVNTIVMKPKPCRVRGRLGVKPGFKKAIVTLQPGDTI